MKRFFQILFLGVALFSCTDPYENETFVIYDMLPAASYLDTREDLSEWVELLHHADMYNAVNQATKAYTLLVPNNDAMDTFLEAYGVSEVKQLSVSYAKALVQYHVISGAVDQKEFLIGGNLAKQTLSEDYLSISFDDSETSEGGLSSVYVNNSALVSEFQIEITNGYIYTLEGVLKPLVETVYDRLVENEEYSIFKEAVEATGFDKVLNTVVDTIPNGYGGYSTVNRSFTAFVVSNSTFALDNIDSMSDLASKVGADADYTGEDNLLYQYVAYHVLSSSKYAETLFSFSDGETSAIWNTKATNQVISTHVIDEVYYLNYSAADESGISLLEGKSDILAKNGMLQEVNNYMPVFSPEPVTVIWDFCEYDDIISVANAGGASNGLGDIFQQVQEAEYRFSLTTTAVTSYEWKTYSTASSWERLGYMITKTTDGGITNTYGAYKNDFLVVNLGYMGYAKTKTPTIIQGKYKVEVFYATAGSLSDFMSGGSQCQFTLDEEVSEVDIYKGATATVGIASNTVFESIEFDLTEQHQFKLLLQDARASTHSSYRLQLDYIKFTPIN